MDPSINDVMTAMNAQARVASLAKSSRQSKRAAQTTRIATGAVGIALVATSYWCGLIISVVGVAMLLAAVAGHSRHRSWLDTPLAYTQEARFPGHTTRL